MTEPAPRVDARDRTRVRRLPEKAVSERAVLDAILDEGLVAHVGLVDEGDPVVIPVGYGRDGDDVLIHGSTASRLMRAMAGGARVCVTVTLLDGMVFARSAFESSMHYRSAVIFGSARSLEGDEKIHALRIVTEHLQPGRWATLREPLAKELLATSIVALPIVEWSVKVSNRPPDDPPEDVAGPSWAGVVPMHTTAGVPVDAPDLRAGIHVPVEVTQWHR